jgi:hypothetical protein
VSVEDDERSGRPSTIKTTENVEKVRELIHEDRHRTIRELADTAGISYGRKRSELWHSHNWLLHHENAPTPTSLKTTEFVTNNNMVIVPNPPYWPDLAPCNFALFPKLKMKLKGRFETVSDIQT